jgi:hypothetical protein
MTSRLFASSRGSAWRYVWAGSFERGLAAGLLDDSQRPCRKLAAQHGEADPTVAVLHGRPKQQSEAASLAIASRALRSPRSVDVEPTFAPLCICIHAPGVAHELTRIWGNSGFLPRGPPALRSCSRESAQRRRWHGWSCPTAATRTGCLDIEIVTASHRRCSCSIASACRSARRLQLPAFRLALDFVWPVRLAAVMTSTACALSAHSGLDRRRRQPLVRSSDQMRQRHLRPLWERGLIDGRLSDLYVALRGGFSFDLVRSPVTLPPKADGPQARPSSQGLRARGQVEERSPVIAGRRARCWGAVPHCRRSGARRGSGLVLGEVSRRRRLRFSDWARAS